MAESRGNILVVDDDESIREMVGVMLERAGYSVVLARDGQDGLKRLFAERPSLVVLDVNMPQLDGFQTLERIRDMTDVPVLMLTAHAMESEKVRALKGGADDYVTKPFGKQELVARVEALLRRSKKSGVSDSEGESAYSDGLLSVDFAQRRVMVAELDAKLTPLEFRLLAVLVRHRNQVLSRDQLLELVWGNGDGSSRDEVKVYIGYLRRKLEKVGLPAEVIETVRGFGYRYAAS